MQIEAGKFYRTRDGRKVGPMELTTWEDGGPWRARLGELFPYWGDSGKWNTSAPEDSGNDLIEEWVEPTDAPEQTGPVRIVSKRVIEPGTYGRVVVHPGHGCKYVTLTGNFVNLTPENVADLRSMAMIFSQLAEASDDQP